MKLIITIISYKETLLVSFSFEKLISIIIWDTLLLNFK